VALAVATGAAEVEVVEDSAVSAAAVRAVAAPVGVGRAQYEEVLWFQKKRSMNL